MHLVRDLGGAKAFKAILEKSNQRLEKAGLPPLHLNAMVNSDQDVDELREAGLFQHHHLQYHHQW